jgi:imidazolonepropionase-like amidohydrolase
MDIVIQGNRIAEVKGVGTPGAPIDESKRPKNASREIDASSMYVLPGFVDVHTHTGGFPKAPEAEYVYKLWLGHGVTTTRDAGLARELHRARRLGAPQGSSPENSPMPSGTGEAGRAG